MAWIFVGAQAVALAVGLLRARRFPFMLLAIAASLVLLCVPAAGFPRHAVWERTVWFPVACVLIPAQALASLEALFRFGERYVLASRIAVALGCLAGAAALAFLPWPHGDFVGQAVQVATAQRVACTVFLLLACGFYASVAARDLLLRPEGAHLLLLTAWMLCWMIPALRPIPTDWPTWFATDWMITARAGILVVWVGAVALRKD